MSEETTSKPNIHGLLAPAQRKSEEAQKRVHQAIDQLLRERIKALRTQQGQKQIERQWAERQQHQAWTNKT
jgi:hypothetical protein